MPVISFASPKGGVGKSTSAILLASELAYRGAEVCILDGDPNQVAVDWALSGKRPKNVSVIGSFPEDEAIKIIELNAAKFPFVLIDLEGSKNIKMSRSVIRSDLVLIPLQGSHLDAVRALDAIRMIKAEEEAYRRPIPHRLLFTRTSAAFQSRDIRYIREQMDSNGIQYLSNALVERAAFRAIFSYGGGLRDLPSDEISNIDAAVYNASVYADEVLGLLTTTSSAERGVA